MTGSFLVTGAAGFIGAALAERLIKNGEKVIGVDNLNDYYDPTLKKARIEKVEAHAKEGSWSFHKLNIQDKSSLDEIFDKEKPQIVINLAAQAGVRYSLENPSAYIDSNLVGFSNVLEGCRQYNVKHLIYASSSSVYGGNKQLPFHERQPVNHPVSLYAATKKANELMAHTYSHLYELPATGLRFFTVYGPWGRPDMAPMIFAKAILNKNPIKIFNQGKMQRDFTYISDIVEGVFRCCYKPASPNPAFDPKDPDPASASAPHRLFNIGNSQPIDLMRFIELLEDALGEKAIKNFQPMQPGDVIATAAETSALAKWVNFQPSTQLSNGLEKFANWYRSYYKA